MLNSELLPDPERRLGPDRRLSGYIRLRPHIPPRLTQLLPSSPTRQAMNYINYNKFGSSVSWILQQAEIMNIWEAS